MTAISVSAPFPILTDIDGDPLDAGYVYIGQANLDPVAFPKAAYWDASLTTPAAQPIRTTGGYPVRNGSPARIYTDGDYSIRINNKNGTLVYSSPAATDRMDSALVGYDGGTVQDVLDGAKSLQDYAALRAYTGRATRIYIAGLLVTAKPAGITGVFQYDPTDTTSIDNGGTIIVGADGRRWKRDISGDKVSVGWFGASSIASASTNTAAIQAAANYCESAAGSVLQGVPGTYSVNGTITIRCNCDLSSMTLNAPGATMTGPVLFVGKGLGTASASRGLSIKLPKVVNTSHAPNTWIGSGSYPGVELANIYHCQINVNRIYGFVVGLDCGGYDFGCGPNTITFTDYVTNNKKGIRLLPKGSGGWVNGNTFIAPIVRIDSSYGVAVSDTRQIVLEPFDITNSTQSWPNGNEFINPTVEGDAPEFHIEVCGSDNVFTASRTETVGTTQKIKFTGHATDAKTTRNLFVGGYNFAVTVFTSSGNVNGNGLIGPTVNVFDSTVTNPALTLVNTGSSNNPLVRAFRAGSPGVTIAASATNWTYQLTALNSFYKANTDAFARVKIGHEAGTIYLGDGSFDPTSYLNYSASGTRFSSNVIPATNNAQSLGVAGLRWSEVFSVNGTINTSDARLKEQVRELSDAEKAVAIKCKGLLRVYKMKSAVEKKGNAARLHVGIIAQELKTAFESEGLDAFGYGILCYDKWGDADSLVDEGGNVISPAVAAGDMYSIRYDELFAFIIAAL